MASEDFGIRKRASNRHYKKEEEDAGKEQEIGKDDAGTEVKKHVSSFVHVKIISSERVLHFNTNVGFSRREEIFL